MSTIPSTGPLSVSDIASEYDLDLKNLDFNRLSNIARLPMSRDMNSFRGTTANDFVDGALITETITGITSSDLHSVSADRGVIRALVNMSDQTTGTIYDGGGGSVSFVLYVYSGTIYAQYGDASEVGGDYEISYAVPSSWTTTETHEIVISCDSRGYGLAKMYVDGILVSAEYNATPVTLNDVMGSDPSGTGKQYGNIAITRMGAGGTQFTGGTIKKVYIYDGPTTSPVLLLSEYVSSNVIIDVGSGVALLRGDQGIIHTNLTIDKNSTGIIYESGGTGVGVALYVYDGTVYLTAGLGSQTLGDITLSWIIPDYISTSQRTEIVGIIKLIDDLPKTATLFVNTRQVAETTGPALNHNVISGSNSGGTGTIYGGSVRAIDLPSENYTYTGTIYETLIHRLKTSPVGGITYDIITGGKQYRVHAFTTVGTIDFTVYNTIACDILLVAGGGGGGGVTSSGASGGGGAGGLVLDLSRTVTAGTYSIDVGGGGTAGGNALVNGGNGGNTTGFGLTAKGGGGGGGSSDRTTWLAGSAGGSGGGGGGGDVTPNGAGGAATQPGTNSGVTTDAGFAGGASASNSGDCGGGGGGAGEVGDDFLGEYGGASNDYKIQGGDGLDMSSYFTTAFGDNGWFAGGGGAFGRNYNTSAAGGLGGGGAGGSSGTANTGGGGGGRDLNVSAGAGGSGNRAHTLSGFKNCVTVV
jgi:hypothetical protein